MVLLEDSSYLQAVALKYQGLKIEKNLAQRDYMLMGVESLELKASFSQRFPYQKQRLWQISLLLNLALKDKVTAKVNEPLEKDIIEKVEGPTVWVSPVVVIPKLSGDIRLCADMRRANETIIWERLPIPTIDEVLESLNMSGVFSKLDLRWNFTKWSWILSKRISLL